MVHGFTKLAVGAVLLALMVAPVVGFSHAVVPHGHTHASDGALHTAIAQGLESILMRKDIAVPVVYLAVLCLMYCVVRSRLTLGTQIDTFVYTHALRRGIFPYRKFG